MRAAAVLTLLSLCAPAAAQLGAALDRPDPRRAPRSSRALPGLGDQLGSPSERSPAPVSARPSEPERRWPGPQIQLGYAFYRLSDGYAGGDVHAAAIEVFVQVPLSELRIGVLGEVGGRNYSLGGDDLMLRGGLEIGAQMLGIVDPVVPHFSVLVTAGGVVGNRFETTVAHAFGGGGLAVGAELRLHRNLHLGAQLSYLRLEMDGAAYDVFQLRLVAGL